MFNKTTRLAIAAMTVLAEVYGAENPTLTAIQIARARGIPRPFVAKLMTTLSLRGLVTGTRGPGGGYKLARAPEAISLLAIASSFERMEESACPLERGHMCSDGTPCALHTPLHVLQESYRMLLTETNLAAFAPAPLVLQKIRDSRPKRPLKLAVPGR